MIKANELRIGNWVYEFGSWHQIEPEDLMLDIFKPIPLTEEILLKCGLIKYDIKDYIFLDTGFNLTDYNDGNGYRLVFDGCDKSIEIKYLHQLQNLYFALTGEELTVNL